MCVEFYTGVHDNYREIENLNIKRANFQTTSIAEAPEYCRIIKLRLSLKKSASSAWI